MPTRIHRATVQHNLGTVYLATDRPEAAVEVLEKSVAIRSEAVGTQNLLEQAIARCGMPATMG